MACSIGSYCNHLFQAHIREQQRLLEVPVEIEKQYEEDDPRHHTTDMRKLLTAVIEHARTDAAEISDPKAQALFETSAEVLTGLRKAFEDFERQFQHRNERVWQKAS